MQGFVYEQAITFNSTNATRAAQAIGYYSETNLPTLRTLLPPPDSLFYNWTVSSGANKTNVKPPHPVLHGRQSRKASPVLRTSTRSAAIPYTQALRASPQWENTLFILTFDENGGFGDHVTSSSRRPVTYLTYTETAPDGKAVTLDFTRLGVRVLAAWLISPFLANLWELDIFLTPRVAFSSTFEHFDLEEAEGHSGDAANAI
ncbi:hypothetical protein L208DRAFT_1383237 [Tricholoma matsutake]|nr:hypothetical protein L208DRAFT_1383237 [Tricholoma matsutake 945]